MSGHIRLPISILYVFIDGIGLGISDPKINPFTRFSNGILSALGKGEFHFPGYLLPTDAHMGVSGLPQSATGQTSLFTGVNAPSILGRHVTAFPTFSLKPYIKYYSLLKVLQSHQKSAVFLNSYSNEFLDFLKTRKGQRFASASSLMQLSSNSPFFTMDDYYAGKSMYMDITNWFLRSYHKKDIPLVSPKESGRKCMKLAREYQCSVYEYFFSDKIGHKQSFGAAKRIISHLDGFLEGIWEEIDPEKELVIIASDHGNLEDLSTKKHTNNLVPTIVYGCGAEYLKEKVHYLYDIPRGILQLLGILVDFLDNVPKDST